ncbi:hypothetical protein ACIU3Q_004024 [Salmonella enterica subsp. enterica serovar Kokomlemle]
MATKQKYTNYMKATVWNKKMRMDKAGSIPIVMVIMFEMINTTKSKEWALYWMQRHLDKCKEREAANADVQTLQKGD